MADPHLSHASAYSLSRDQMLKALLDQRPHNLNAALFNDGCGDLKPMPLTPTRIVVALQSVNVKAILFAIGVLRWDRASVTVIRHVSALENLRGPFDVFVIGAPNTPQDRVQLDRIMRKLKEQNTRDRTVRDDTGLFRMPADSFRIINIGTP